MLPQPSQPQSTTNAHLISEQSFESNISFPPPSQPQTRYPASPGSASQIDADLAMQPTSSPAEAEDLSQAGPVECPAHSRETLYFKVGSKAEWLSILFISTTYEFDEKKQGALEAVSADNC
ncbi:hypothetical protein SISSUDRAFT_1067947 [Sistotremastrum suecicum HHB10207 ss-3]|uniref:Uncharacterized protein n=1 Tax=Sistotremastrum suecicum HHB10207 ss-3 TaxID=1314776 RepID=A0A165WJG5_9AGAM|nr:hypothetical protein SISSUDRAFT_1067947 [Sistotremastrum suecicum HHB10207 ss-3]